MMADVFGEESSPLENAYLRSLLGTPHFWAVAALEGDTLVGGLTAHTLPMTKAQGAEIFIYDLAVRKAHQRKGVGRLLVATLREAAEAQGILTCFVPADNEDTHAIHFYRAIGAAESKVTLFTFETFVHN